MLANHFPNAIVTGVDFSPALIESAKTFAAKLPCSDRVEFVCAELDDLDGLHTYDVVFVGEYLEHTEAYQNVIDTLESHLEQGGVFIATMPYGPFGELIRYGQPRSSIQGHVIHWEYSDILEVFGGLLDFDCLAVRFGSTPKGDPHGHWVVHFRTSDAKTGKIDLARKATTTRPYESLAICMIGFDGDAKWVNLCMERIRDVADEIYVALHGDQVAMEATLKPWGVNLIKCPDLAPHIEPGRVQPPGDFGWFRNESISQAEADWIMWLDFDEIVTHPERLRRYLTDSPYNGHGLKQKHLTVDQQTSHDVPIRIFRNGRGYRFFGCTHEHAEDGMDNPIYPTFEIPDCDLAHYGYLTEQQRREKCIGRNFQWLMLDREVYPGRQLTDVLFARDCINFAHWERDGNGGRNTPKAVAYLNECLGYYRKGPWFNNPKHIYFKLIFGFYQKAMEWAEVGLPFRIGGKELRFGNPDELEDYSIAMIKQTCEELRFDYPQYREGS
jgi:SAM-dependent methyltransferase